MTAHILVIDDDPVQRRLLKNMIERSGHVAHMAENGRAGLDMLDRKGGLINVILLDLMMPEMNGLETLQNIKRLYPEIIVVMITGSPSKDNVHESIQGGAGDFIIKPFNSAKVIETLHRAWGTPR